MSGISTSSIENSLQAVRQNLLGQRNVRGHWVGELSASALSTATAISAFSFLLENGSHADESKLKGQIESGIGWLIANQNEDGGWGDTEKNYSNISTTMLVVAAFQAAEKADQYAELVSRGRSYIDKLGGVEGIRKRYGDDKTFAVPILANAAMAGLVDWTEVGVLPFEAACVPQRFYHLLNLPVVSYAIPALVAIGQAKFHFDPPRNPVTRLIRKFSIERSLNVLLKMQPESGGYLEAIPLTSFVCMALIKCGRIDHPVVQNGIRFLLSTFRQTSNDQGTWPIDTNLATWVTTLSVNALSRDQDFEFNADWKPCLDWVLDCQYKTVHPFTGSAPGGWGWSDLTGAVPDADDTPGSLLALRVFYQCEDFSSQRKQIVESALSGVNWLLGLQNRDGGWPTFCRGWGRLPFDRSGNDLTAHVIRALIAWHDEFGPAKLKAAIRRGFAYLEKNQDVNGSWLPLWFGNQDQIDDINPFYGTAKVLHAYQVSERLSTKAAQNGLRWIRENQNADGGWGGGPSVKFSFSESTCSSVEETSLCTEALLLDDHPDSVAAAAAGLRWLQTVTENDAVGESTPIGFYFAKLWYYEKLYPLIFATSAFGLSKSKGAVAEIRRENKLDSIHQ